jgi:hypothetical protein
VVRHDVVPAPRHAPHVSQHATIFLLTKRKFALTTLPLDSKLTRRTQQRAGILFSNDILHFTMKN